MGNKKKDKMLILRTKEERKYETNKIITKLTELQLTIQYEPIKELFKILQDFINNGNEHEINIPFPLINKRIKGYLTNRIDRECVVLLKHQNN